MLHEGERALPAYPLMRRVGPIPAIEDGGDELWLKAGRVSRDRILELLPSGWSFDGRSVLDFGCGAGRVLRHMVPEAEAAAEFWACDVHAPSIEWLAANLAPPFRVLTNGDSPPLPFPDGNLDLIYALSVFSHLSDTASEWLLELRRVLKPDGILLATFQGPDMWAQRGTASTDPPLDAVGHHVYGQGISFWEGDGPQVYLAEWWVREHWGRAFDITYLGEFTRHKPYGQDVAVMRPNGHACNSGELDAPNVDDPREARGLALSRALILAELAWVRGQSPHVIT